MITESSSSGFISTLEGIAQNVSFTRVAGLTTPIAFVDPNR